MQKAHDELEVKVAERTKELQETITELERFHDATVDREMRMKELRDEIERLKAQLEQKSRDLRGESQESKRNY